MDHDELVAQPEQSSTAPRRRIVALHDLLELLRSGTLELQGLMPWSSNYTFLVSVQSADLGTYAVYKPCKGERPLWDFPSGTLYKREVAAFLVSEALGWALVPPTVLRDGPHGVGSAQLYIDADHEQHYFTLRDRYPLEFQRMALFDVLINNADRKGGHCLIDSEDHIWAIDHGIAFHEEDKLRTVIWDWAGEVIPAVFLADVERLRDQLDSENSLAKGLAQLLLPREIKALKRRIERILNKPVFPSPGPGRSVPWPSI